MVQYSSGEKARGRALMIGVVLLIACVGALYVSIRKHDKFTAVFALFIGLVAVLGLYSATHE